MRDNLSVLLFLKRRSLLATMRVERGANHTGFCAIHGQQLLHNLLMKLMDYSSVLAFPATIAASFPTVAVLTSSSDSVSSCCA